MSKYGYARASTADQDCSIQEAALLAAGCKLVRSEKRSGSSLGGRDELDLVLKLLEPGDSLIVTRIDRLSRSLADLLKVSNDIRAKGAHLVALEQPIDTSNASGRAFLQMLGVFAEFETELRRERQLEGIAKAKAEGVYKGRKKSVDDTEVRRLRAEEGLSRSQIMARLGISRTSVRRALAAGGMDDGE